MGVLWERRHLQDIGELLEAGGTSIFIVVVVTAHAFIKIH